MRNALFWLSLMGFLSGCTQVFFQPQHQLIDTPTRVGVAYDSETIQAQDGTKLNAWFLPAQGEAKGTILFLHGNAENISTHFRSVAWLPAQGYNVLALDYRGYGASEGLPTLAGAQQDIDAALKHLLVHKNVDSNRILVFGQSLGGALAIFYSAHSAYRANVRGLISDSAFADYRQIARDNLAKFTLTWPFQWLPWFLIDNDYTPIDAVALLSPIPLFIIHGDNDQAINMKHGERLYAQAKQPKELMIVPKAGHIQSLADAEVRERFLAFVQQALSTKQFMPQSP
ncbi:MAG: alpha/beta hydrolase [Gallionella sp.]